MLIYAWHKPRHTSRFHRDNCTKIAKVSPKKLAATRVAVRQAPAIVSSAVGHLNLGRIGVRVLFNN
jgi:hypothetical protein